MSNKTIKISIYSLLIAGLSIGMFFATSTLLMVALAIICCATFCLLIKS